MFELNGNPVSLEDIQNKANEKGYDVDTYINFLKEQGLVEKTSDVATQDAPVTSTSDTASSSEDISLEQPKVDTQAVAEQAMFESVPFSQQIGMVTENIFDMVTDLVTDKEERQETVEAVKNQFVNMPQRLKDTFTKSVPAFGLKAMQVASVDPLFSQSPEIDEFIVDKFKELEASQKLYKDTGEGIVSGIKQANASDFVSGIVGANLQMVETILPAMLTGGASLPIQITAPMYVDYNTAKAKEVYGEDDPDAIDKLVANGQDEFAIPATLGMVASGLEYAGFKGISKYIMGQPGKGTMLATLFLTGNKEGLTELGQSAIEEVNTAAAEGKSGAEIAKAMADGLFSDKGLESYLNGFLGSTGISAAGNTVNRAIRSDNASVRDVNNKINKIADLTYAKNQTRNKQVKDAISLDIQEAEQDLKTYITEKRKINDVLNEDQRQSLINIIDQKDKIASDITSLKQQVKDGEITNKEFGYAFRALNNQDKKLSEEIETINATALQQLTEQQVEVVEQQVEELSKIGRQGKVTRMTAEQIANMQEEGFDGQAASQEFGFIKQFGDGSFEVVLNEDKPAVGTAAHEFLHAVLFKSIGADTNIQDALGDALVTYVNDKTSGVSDSFINRISAYIDPKTGQRDANFGEETITIMSESIIDGSLQFNETLMTKVGDAIRRFLQNAGLKQVKFDTGRDVFNFVKDYSKSISEGKVNKAILKVAAEGAKGKLVEGRQDAEGTTQFSKEASDKVQQIYEDQGAGGAFDIFEQFKPITTRIARRFRDVPGYDEQLIIDEIETGNRGIFDLIRDYKPESGVPLAAYINKFLPARSIEAGNRILKTEFEEDVTEARGVAAEETVKQQPERRTKAKVLADELNIADKVTSEVTEANVDKTKLKNFKSVPNAATNAVGELLGISPAKIKSKANLTKDEVASAQRWFNKNAQLVIDALPQGFDVEGQATGVPRTVLQALYTQKESRAKTKAGLKGQVKRTNIKDSEFLALVDIIDGKPTRNRNTSARIIALADLLGKTITNQELRKTDPSLARIRSGMSDIMFSKAKGAKTFNMVEKPSDVQIPLVSIQLLKDLLEGKTRTGFRDMDAEFEPGITFDQKASEIANNFLNQSPEVKSLVENTMTGGVRGGLFLTKPEFNKRIKVKDVKDVSEKLKSYRYNYNSEKRLTKKAVESFNDKDVVADRNARLDILHNFWKDVETYLKDNPQDQWFFEALVRDTSRGQQALTRVLAPFRGYAVDENGKPIYNLEVVEEHSKPQNNVSYAYLNAAIEGKVDELKPVIEASYMQISLLKTDDKAIAAAGLEQTMPDIYFDVIVPKIKSGELKLAPGMAAAVRLAAVGTPYAPKVSDNVIDLNKIYMPELDQTIAQHFGIDKIKDTKAANILLIEELAGINFENTKLPEAQLSKAISNARPVNMYSKAARGMSTFDFDETLIIEGENFIVATKGDDVQRISSGDWPLLGPTLADEGYSFDFTDFVNVRGGVDGPLLQKMKNQIKKYGTQNVFVLTARPAESATAIHEWLKTKGINIPFENITGLGNSTGDAKAAWMLDKYAEGYNDMYFVDDALPNVEAVQHVFDQLDVKGKSVQAKIKFSKDLSSEFNKMLERTKGIGAEKIFSRIGAQKRGKNVGRFTFFVPPSADDFAGLLRYFVGKGEQGNKDLDFFNRALIKPFARADRDMKEARQSILDDHKTLRKEMPQVVKKLGKMIDDSGFTFDNAIRVYLWDKAGFDIPGLSKRDIAFLTNRVKTDQDLKTYADVIGQISKQKEGYIEPSEYWNVESIASDLQNVVNKQGRKKFLAEWKENVDIIFSPENLNKIEATYGSNFREALENILWRMENGTNRAKGMGRLEGAWNNWVNNSVGAIMFFNARSAVLQTLSTVNFINFEDNNIFAAAKAFGNQKQYWKDFSFLFNSDFLKQRRAGLQTNINEAEIASAVAGTANKAKAALQYLLKQGFLPTQIADSFAIASGGATYYRNRIKKYVKQGLSQTEAEAQAMEDFMEIAEETQQSARPDRISQQQASSLGRIILAFANTPMQYARLIKKAAGDLVKGRGDWRSNVSRIIYYGAIQNIIFSSLQSAIFALAFDDEEPEQDEIDTKVQRTLNGMIDSLLRGSGLAGAVVSTLKNVINRFIQESEKKSRADYGNVLVDALNVSPPIGSKSRKLYNATKTYKYNREVMGEMNTFDLENPVWDAVGNVVSATTNLPLDRGFRKIDNMKEALNQDNETWQRIAVALGWDQWSLGIDSRKEVDEARELIKEKKKEEKKKSQQRCTKIKSDGTRCKIMVNKPKTRCHYHD